MNEFQDSVCLGTLIKTHGVKGRVILNLDQQSFDEIKNMEWVFIEIDGLPVPFFIEDYEEKTSDSLILTFEDITSEEKAAELAGCKLYINNNSLSNKKITKEYNPFYKLTGYTVIDIEYGELGVLQDILDINMNPLLQIVTMGKEILLPANAKFIVSRDDKKKLIFVNTPDGLIHLF